VVLVNDNINTVNIASKFTMPMMYLVKYFKVVISFNLRNNPKILFLHYLLIGRKFEE
jgi:hypothetical protein